MPKKSQMLSAPSKSLRYLGVSIKLAIAVGLAWALYQQLFVAHDFKALVATFVKTLHHAPLRYLLFILALVPVNLMLEAKKFQLFLNASTQRNSKKMLIFSALKQVLAGLTVGVFTPNRVGEYAGRLTNTHPGERKSIIAATLLGGVAQWIPLLYGGIVGLLLFDTIGIQEIQTELVQLVLVSLLGIAFFILYFHFNSLASFVSSLIEKYTAGFKDKEGWFWRKLTYFEKYVLKATSLQVAEGYVRAQVLIISTFRYGIYLLQLVLALKFVGLDAGWGSLFAGCAILFLAQTFLPLPAVVQALARTELALLLWASFAPNPLSIAVASMLIFVLNLGLPSLVGLVIILRSNVDQTLGIDPV